MRRPSVWIALSISACYAHQPSGKLSRKPSSEIVGFQCNTFSQPISLWQEEQLLAQGQLSQTSSGSACILSAKQEYLGGGTAGFTLRNTSRGQLDSFKTWFEFRGQKRSARGYRVENYLLVKVDGAGPGLERSIPWGRDSFVDLGEPWALPSNYLLGTQNSTTSAPWRRAIRLEPPLLVPKVHMERFVLRKRGPEQDRVLWQGPGQQVRALWIDRKQGRVLKAKLRSHPRALPRLYSSTSTRTSR